MAVRRILVTGGTGNTGRALIWEALSRGIGVRVGERRPRTADHSVEVAALDFHAPATFAPALSGCDGLFLMRPPALTDMKPTLLKLLEVAAREGVKHVVFLSTANAPDNRFVPHHVVENALILGSIPYTILRPGFFAQNLGDAYQRDIAEDRRLYVPAGRGLVSFVDVRDVAEVAARAFAEPERHRGRGYTLTGAEALGFEQVAETLSDVLGHAIDYRAASLTGYALHLKKRGLSAGQIAVQTLLHAGLRFGQGAKIDPTLGELLGRAPRTLASYVRDHVGLWKA